MYGEFQRAWCRLIAALNHKGKYEEALLVFRRMQADGVLPNRATLIATLESCICPLQVKVIHLCVSQLECEQETVVATALLSAYGRCGDVPNAEQVFAKLVNRDLVSWTALITAYAGNGHCVEAFHHYRRMLLEGVGPNRVTFLSLLSACTKLRSLSEAEFVHSHVFESRKMQDMVIQNAIICMYDRCSSLKNAKLVFDAMGERDVISWTSMIFALAQHGEEKAAILVYRGMNLHGQQPNKVTFLAILEACTKTFAVEEGESVHACISESGLDSDVVVATALVGMYGRHSRTLEKASKIFETVESKDTVLWNAMLEVYSQHSLREQVLELFQCMEQHNMLPQKAAFVSVLSVLTGTSCLATGRWIHSKIVARGFDSDTIIRNALMNMFGKCGSPEEAHLLFEEACPTIQNRISWNTMVAVFSQNGDFPRSIETFRRMQLCGVPPDKATLLTILYACSAPEALNVGMLAHSQGTRLGLGEEPTFQTALIVMYGKCGALEEAEKVYSSVQLKGTACRNAMVAAYGYHGRVGEARLVFDGCDERDTATWNAMVVACASGGRWREAFRLLQQMQVDGAVPDHVTLVTVVGSLAAGGAVAEGRAVHRFAAENGLLSGGGIAVANSLVDMYGKCGCVADAWRLVRDVAPDAVTWNSLIGGLAQHGYGGECVEALREMQLGGFLPTGVTMMSVLHACGHVGLLEEGCRQFGAIAGGDYGLEPIEEQWGCVVDLLGRAGHLEEAEIVMLEVMPFRPNLVAWTSLLGACRLHGDLERGEVAALRVLEFDPENSAARLMLESAVQSVHPSGSLVF